MERMNDYKKEFDLACEKIVSLEEKNKKLKEKLSEITMVADDEKQSIEHILELEKENKRLKEINESQNEEIQRFKDNAMEDMRVQTKLEEKIRFLEECLDRKEKLNEKYRKELKNYVYDAKQVRDIC